MGGVVTKGDSTYCASTLFPYSGRTKYPRQSRHVGIWTPADTRLNVKPTLATRLWLTTSLKQWRLSLRLRSEPALSLPKGQA